ncbi:AlpA family transcriptional regulator [Maridesulfovibrio ferrireducens]|uniref:helix-turn-helix transcriptional regulator n=1 Tax=Maridesulfovibrio ferrireducens TaxID=246191 RepID=UPI001A275EA1|nr:helix-turn-helix domain-containing protein [Maridesulfovibrio ferrireducens]MBI9112268.1 helix-turn-helix domain-containing protein [Maridesulfovibrio ferrireducens]
MSIERNFNRLDVQKILICGKSKFWDLVSKGEFPNAFKVGPSIRIPASDIEAYKEKYRVDLNGK